MANQPLKYGEKILFIIFGAFLAVAVVGFVILEGVRLSSDEPMFENTTHYNLSPLGEKGQRIYQESGCSSCHRAMRAGTNMGLILDGIGSRRSTQWIESFLRNPEQTYSARTIDHGLPPKEASYVSQMSDEKIAALTVFLSELRADRGSSVAQAPPPGDSSFIDSMLNTFAPESWKDDYTDVRKKVDQGDKRPADSPNQ